MEFYAVTLNSFVLEIKYSGYFILKFNKIITNLSIQNKDHKKFMVIVRKMGRFSSLFDNDLNH